MRIIRKRRVERKDVNRRASVFFILILFCTVALVFRVYSLQTGQSHKTQSGIVKRNAVKELYMSPERGDIVDRNGVVLASTRSVYNLVVIPERITGYRKDRVKAVEDFLDTLSMFFSLGSMRTSVAEDILAGASYRDVVIKEDLNDDDLSGVLANIAYINGISVKSEKVRSYPFGGAFLSPLGYVGRVSKDDLNREKDYTLLSSDFTGKMALEFIHDKTLYGTVGVERVALNSKGRVVEKQIAMRPKKGDTLSLTIDAELQLLASELMGEYRGAVVMSDVETGELLVTLSAPTLDSNKLVSGISKDEASDIFSSESNKPLYNRAIRGQYPPASTIKPIMGMAGLDGKFIEAKDRVWSGPYFELGGHRFRDWKRMGHGWVNLYSAIEVSSDVYFYKLARLMGIEYIHDYLYEFGFGQKTGVGLEREEVGLLPNSEWKKRAKNLPWYGGETVTVGIGQGYFMATPMQINSAFSTLLNGGTRYRPNLLSGVAPEILSELVLDSGHVEDVKKGMNNVINGAKGTARGISRGNVVELSGKTGTSQVISSNGVLNYENSELAEKLRDHAWFTGYAPSENPKVVVTVFVENGESGSRVAAPIAKKLLNKYAERYILNGK